MPRTHSTNHQADPMLSKLLEVESGLVTEADQLTAQLQVIQEKRNSLKNVIGLFSSSDVPAALAVQALTETESPNGNVNSQLASAPAASTSNTKTKAPAKRGPQKATKEPKAATSQKAAKPAAKAPKSEAKPAAKSADKAAKPAKITKAKAEKSNKPAAPAATTEKAPSKTAKLDKPKALRKPQGWQKYMRDEFSKQSLPEIVTSVLQRQPNDVFEIPEIVDTIFVDEMPKDARSKAGNRVSNILSTGVKDNKWYRGKTGQYSLSRSAAEANVAS